MSSEVWQCQQCFNVNLDGTKICYYCEGILDISLQSSRKHCSTCTAINSFDAQQCQICCSPLSKSTRSKETESNSNQKTNTNQQGLYCFQCNFYNNLMNKECLCCGCNLSYKEQKQSKAECEICGVFISKNILDQHFKNCILSKDLFAKTSTQSCNFCDKKFPIEEISDHELICRQNIMFQKSSLEEINIFSDRLTSLQAETIAFMNQKSKKDHYQTLQILQKRVKKLGYQQEHLFNLKNYIQNQAPVIIHVHLKKYLQFFIKDTHYRNQFETNNSSGSKCLTSRTSWEDRMFDKKYSKATNFQKVKYGVINLTNDRKGIKCCSAYGPSYFLLKSHVRHRCTFTNCDSSNANAIIGTFKYSFKVIQKVSDEQLRGALDGSNGMQIGSQCVASYKQVQIHGPIQFNKDIERVFVSHGEIGENQQLMKMVFDFSKKNCMGIQFIQ